MTTATEQLEPAHGSHEEHGEEHFSDRQYVIVAAILAALTALEVSTYYFDYGKTMLPVLLFLMVIKFFTVTAYFMHLKFDNKLFSALFYTGLGLAIFVYVGVLLTFKVFFAREMRRSVASCSAL